MWMMIVLIPAMHTLVAALLRVAGVTAGLAGLWLTSPAGWLPRTRISSETLRSVIEYGLSFLHWQVTWCEKNKAIVDIGYKYLNLNGFGWNLRYKWDHGAHWHKKNCGKSPPNATKKCFLFCHQYNVAFQTLNPALILTVFGTSDLNWCAGVYTCEKFLHRGFASPKKTAQQQQQQWPFNCLWSGTTRVGPRSSILGRVLVNSILVKRHNCRRSKSFRGIVDIRRMCLCTLVLMGDYGFVHFFVNTTSCLLISGSRKNTV